MSKIYHIYAKGECLYHSLTEQSIPRHLAATSRYGRIDEDRLCSGGSLIRNCTTIK